MANIVLTIIIVIVAIILKIVTQKIEENIVKKTVEKSKIKWDDIFYNKNVFKYLSHLSPAILIYLSGSLYDSSFNATVERLGIIYMLFILLFIVEATLGALEEIYNSYPISKEKPIKSYVQLFKMFIFLLGGVIIISAVLGKSPWKIISGIGAMTAVIMLVFKDSILSFTSGIQLAFNKMVKVGDWIEMPGYGIDGDVLEIGLNSVKIQNWDKTIATIPVYKLMTDPFKNWKGMTESGGRRIKRSINIDMESIKICDGALLEKLKKVDYIEEYIKSRKNEIDEHNKKNVKNSELKINGRALTNIGLFREYMYNYIKNSGVLNEEMTLLVRQLKPTANGLPIEIYCFTKTTVWAEYEGIQSDFFDHFIAIMNEFDLKVFQGMEFNK